MTDEVVAEPSRLQDRLGPPVRRITLAQARRVALAAQGLADARPTGPINSGHVARVIDRLKLLQLDSVSALARAHYLPLFSRLGAYDMALLDRMAAHHGKRPPPARRRLFEYWAHEACLIPVAHQPLFRWRMAEALAGLGMWKGIAAYGRDHQDSVRRTLETIAARGPIGVSELEDAGQRAGAWWGWNDGKRALEYLFWTGQVTTAARRGFERLYDLPERVLPPEVLEAPTPQPEAAQRTLMMQAATVMGIATAGDLRAFYRLPAESAGLRLAELVEAGLLEHVAVAGWRQAAFMPKGAILPRKAEAVCLLVPFDPLVFERARVERLFGFTYRIEIYVPAEKRQHGYYVLPFLMGDRLVARLDLKRDRARCRLLVRSTHVEPGLAPAPVAEALARELRLMAAWLELERVEVAPRGELASTLLAMPDMKAAPDDPAPTDIA